MARTTAIDASSLDEFIEVPFRLHAKDPLFVPPLRAAVKEELVSPRVPKQLFLHGDEGRVAALVHPLLPFGQIGYFEAANEEAARSLLEAGMEWLRARGQKQVVGPMNGGAHRLHRFMVSGFERTPFLFEPRNPAEYPRWFEASGFARVATWQTYEAPRAWLESLRGILAPGVVRALEAGQKIELLEGADAIARLHPLLDAVWAGHVGYASLDRAEFVEVFGGALALMSKRHVGVLVDAGKDVGTAFMYPDWIDEARALQGDASGWARWVTSKPLPKRIVLHTVAFRPEARRTGGPFLMLDQGLKHTLEDGYEEIVIALVTDEWRLFARALEPTRTYALFGRTL